MSRESIPRDAGDDAPSLRFRSRVGNRWAVIVGVSAYQDQRLELRYAHRDAQDIYDFLLTPVGGAFSSERMRLLLDEQATTRNVTKAVSSFLAETEKDDLVLIYFACHGAPDELGVERPLYFLTHDTDLDDVAGTAWPMDNLAWCLRSYVRAERVVIIADTCHSAGMQAGARGSDLSAAVLNRYLEELRKSAPGIAYLTSAGKYQRSYEDEKWGGGHGAFTWFLLEGLRGDADGFGGRPKDGVIGLRELAEFVRDQVRRETKRRQEPVLGGAQYDAEFPLAVTGGLNVQEHIGLARALLDVGWLSNDPAPFLMAAREADQAVHDAALTGITLPDGTAIGGEALLAAGEYGDAVHLLERDLARSADKSSAVSWLHLGLAKAASHVPDAAEALERFAEADPHSADAPWAADFAAFLRGSPRTMRALLIGIGRFELPEVPPLEGPGNDIVSLRNFLIEHLAVDPANVISHGDQSGTRQNVLDGLRALADESRDDDAVFFYFGGHALLDDDESAPYLVTYDSTSERPAGISPGELHRLLAAIPAASRIVVIDSGCSPSFVRLLQRSPVATVVFAAAPGKWPIETMLDGAAHGAFTDHLLKAWVAAIKAGVELTWDSIIQRIRKDLPQALPRNRPQALPENAAPFLIGNAAELLPMGQFPALDLWRLDRLRNADAPPPSVTAICGRKKWPNGRRVIARSDLAAGRFQTAARTLKAVARDTGDPWAWLECTRAQVAARQFDHALRSLQAFNDLAQTIPWPAETTRVTTAVRTLAEARPRALLVGIGRYHDRDIPAVKGADADLASMRQFLLDKGFAARDIVEVRDRDASRENILARFRSLCDHAASQLGVFYVAGNGSRTGIVPTIVPYDGRGGGAADIMLLELVRLARDARADNLVSILDAGCGYRGATVSSRSVQPTTSSEDAGRGLASWVRRTLGRLPTAAFALVGAVTITARMPTLGDTDDEPVRYRLDAHGAPHGVLTAGLVAALQVHDWRRLTYAMAVASASRKSKLAVLATGVARDEPVFVHRTLCDRAVSELEDVARAPARAAADLAERLLVRLQKQGSQAPAVFLELGLSYMAAGQEDAIRFLRTARHQYEDKTIREAEESTDPDVEVWAREASYHLGRLLYKTGAAEHLTDAVAALRGCIFLTSVILC